MTWGRNLDGWYEPEEQEPDWDITGAPKPVNLSALEWDRRKDAEWEASLQRRKERERQSIIIRDQHVGEQNSGSNGS